MSGLRRRWKRNSLWIMLIANVIKRFVLGILTLTFYVCTTLASLPHRCEAERLKNVWTNCGTNDIFKQRRLSSLSNSLNHSLWSILYWMIKRVCHSLYTSIYVSTYCKAILGHGKKWETKKLLGARWESKFMLTVHIRHDLQIKVISPTHATDCCTTVVRGVNWLLVKRSFVRFVRRTKRATVGSVHETIYDSRVGHAEQPEVAVLFVPSFLLIIPPRAHLSHLHSPACSSPTRHVQIIELDIRRNWIDFRQSSHDSRRFYVYASTRTEEQDSTREEQRRGGYRMMGKRRRITKRRARREWTKRIKFFLPRSSASW